MKKLYKHFKNCDFETNNKSYASFTTTLLSADFSLVTRFLEIEDYIDDKDIDCMDFLPNAKEFQTKTTLAKEMADIQSVTMKLQEDNINLYDVCILFDSLISRFRKMEKYWSKTAKIIKKDFENGVVGAINGSVKELSAGAIAATECLK